MKTQATPAPIPVRLYSPKMEQRIEALESVIESHRALREIEAELRRHDERRDARRAALVQVCDERYANFIDALAAAEAAGAVTP